MFTSIEVLGVVLFVSTCVALGMSIYYLIKTLVDLIPIDKLFKKD